MDDGWLCLDESGASQIYVRPFPVRTGVGWCRHKAEDNRAGIGMEKVFYRDGNKMMAVDVSTRPDLVLSPPRLLFDQRYAFGVGVTTPNYDVLDEGFVMVKSESGSGRLNIVLNWFDELKARLQTGK